MSERLEIIPEPNAQTPDAHPGRRWLLHGPHGAVQFLAWEVPPLPSFPGGLYGVDLGYHSPTPHYAGQEPLDEDCPFLPGGRCYYDGSGLGGDRLMQLYQAGGDQAVFAALREYYAQTFGAPADSEETP